MSELREFLCVQELHLKYEPMHSLYSSGSFNCSRDFLLMIILFYGPGQLMNLDLIGRLFLVSSLIVSQIIDLVPHLCLE